MDWRGLFRRLNPAAAYERVACDPCHGTGFELLDGKPAYVHGRPVSCRKCHGKGWQLVRRETPAG